VLAPFGPAQAAQLKRMLRAVVDLHQTGQADAGPKTPAAARDRG
jgi:hypothetical protein